MLRNKKQCKLITLLLSGLITIVFGFYLIHGSFWTRWDFQLLDYIYKKNSEWGQGVELAQEITFLDITNKTYEHAKSNSLNREYLASINRELSDLGARKIAYDIIFAHPSDSEKDAEFERSVNEVENIYLPVAFELSEDSDDFFWKDGLFFEKLKRFSKTSRPEETGHPPSLHGTSRLRSTSPLHSRDLFYGPSNTPFNTGHINLTSDSDGIYRHYLMIIRLGQDAGYFPSLALALYLDANNIPFSKIKIAWGKEILIPASDEGNESIRIPINAKGETFLPLFSREARDSQSVNAHNFRKDYANEFLRDALADQFVDSRFIFIADVSQGIPDVGKFSLYKNEVPLVIAHAAAFNGLLKNSFYREWSSEDAILLALVIGMLLGGVAMLRNINFLYFAGGIVLIALWGWAFREFSEFRIFPIATSLGSGMLFLSSLVIGAQVVNNRDEKIIKDAFSKYVSEKVVNQILAKPEILVLGGEERVLTAFFSDLAGFSSISEDLSPQELVELLNDYLTEMTDIIIKYDGTVDKFEGDAIIAFFGAPVPYEDHALRACRVAIEMQQRLAEMRDHWKTLGKHQLYMRIGVNTGRMVIGNMGSKTRMDYTMMGDSVNLASRLEGVNKQYQTETIISEFTFEKVKAEIETRELDTIRVMGKNKPIKIYEVLGKKGELSPQMRAILPLFNQGLQYYSNRDWKQALACFEKVLQINEHDGPSLTYRERCIDYQYRPPQENWDGVYEMTSK
jgi:adenylate cyclase